MATYWVSNSGSDAANGTSSITPWQTISKVNGITFLPGDIIMFKRGDVWREQLTIPSSGAAGNPITYTAYGSGARPIINGANVMTGWTNAGSNQWWINCPNATTTMAMVVIGGTIFNEVANQAAVNSASKYFIDVAATPDRLYVYSTVDPATLTAEVSNRNFCILGLDSALRHHIHFKNIECRYAGHSGLILYATQNGPAFNGSCLVDNCVFYANRLFGCVAYDRHSYNTFQNSTANYNGNGFYAWEADYVAMLNSSTAHNIAYGAISQATDGHAYGAYKCTGWLVEGCTTDDDNDAIHLDASSVKADAIIRYNTMYNSRTGSPATPGMGIGSLGQGSLVQIYYNLVVNCASNSLETYTTSAGQIQVYNNTYYHNVSTGTDGIVYLVNASNYDLKNNIMVREYVSGKYVFLNFSATLAVSDYNQMYIRNAGGNPTIRNYWNSSTYTTLGAWQSATSLDAHSLNSDPLFKNVANDWSLQSTSPCINAGIDVGLTRDLLGNPVSGTPDLGCFEYTAGITG